MTSSKWLKKATKIGIGLGMLGGGLYTLIWLQEDKHSKSNLSRLGASGDLKFRPFKRLPPRKDQLASLATEKFDVLVIGGGATGAGCAVDAVSRGLKTAMVEMDDFSSGTSSRSTKLIHGGVRYLQKAIVGLDIEQYRMVKEALYERSHLLDIAPHLSFPLPIMLPVYKWWQLPYYWVRRGDVLSAWSGIRPLVLDPSKTETQNVARNHIVDISKSGLVTIAGGKWTTYRSMAADTLDAAIKHCNLDPVHSESMTDGLLLEGAHLWTPTMYIRLVQDMGLESEVAQHLTRTYGDRAFTVAKMAALTGKRWPIVGQRLHSDFPYIEAEVRYACREYAATAVDIIARRLRLAFLNVQAAEELLPRIVNIMAEELKWNDKEKKKQLELARNFLQTEMGQNINRASKEKIPIHVTREEISECIKQFRSLDVDRKGFISVNDLRRSLKIRGQEITGQELHEILREIDVNHNGQVELDEYIQMAAAIKQGSISHSRFAHLVQMAAEDARKKVTVERSGGGV